jgi:DNA repair exonuclease SbcCD ATPase subunit
VTGSQLQKHRDEAKARIDSLTKTIDAGVPRHFNTSLKKLHQQIDRLRVSKNDFEEQQKKAWALIETLTPKTFSLQAQIKVYENAINERDAMRNPFREQIRELKKQKQEVELRRKELQAKADKLIRQSERVRFWVKGFKDVRLYIIEEITQELELVTNSMLQDLGLTDWWVRYSIEKETKAGTIKRGLNVEILSPDNDAPVKWENWSGGESQRLRIIGALALSEVLLNHAGVSVDLEILDEPSNHLSTHGVRDVVEFLSDRAKHLHRQIFFVDHMAVESDQFTSVITVVKTEQGSHFRLP